MESHGRTTRRAAACERGRRHAPEGREIPAGHDHPRRGLVGGDVVHAPAGSISAPCAIQDLRPIALMDTPFMRWEYAPMVCPKKSWGGGIGLIYRGISELLICQTPCHKVGYINEERGRRITILGSAKSKPHAPEARRLLGTFL